MSKLDELIQKYCPNGVEYKKLSDFATVIRGGNFQKKDFVETGKPCIHYGQMYTHFKNTTDKTLTFVSEEVFNKSKQAEYFERKKFVIKPEQLLDHDELEQLQREQKGYSSASV